MSDLDVDLELMREADRTLAVLDAMVGELDRRYERAVFLLKPLGVLLAFGLLATLASRNRRVPRFSQRRAAMKPVPTALQSAMVLVVWIALGAWSRRHGFADASPSIPSRLLGERATRRLELGPRRLS
jgi:hypothetical protein